ncbi:flagellin [Ureibacillus sp. FSL W7-1570]|uniref:flagellin n=1 Tax=Ureibacillus sp. FSL W7-1570 TaxID=2954593 RepID=UPI003159F98F
MQVGPNSGNEFIVDLTDATTASLRVEKSRNHASQAIGKIDIAIQIISDERAKFGVYQNSLDHIANNVVNYNENMTASESRIRDADIASEMLKQVKYSILSQAVQAVLAQSNQQSSGVLNLLG